MDIYCFVLSLFDATITIKDWRLVSDVWCRLVFWGGSRKDLLSSFKCLFLDVRLSLWHMMIYYGNGWCNSYCWWRAKKKNNLKNKVTSIKHSSNSTTKHPSISQMRPREARKIQKWLPKYKPVTNSSWIKWKICSLKEETTTWMTWPALSLAYWKDSQILWESKVYLCIYAERRRLAEGNVWRRRWYQHWSHCW